MEVQKDFREFLALLNEHEVKFIIVGGYALADFGFSSLDITIDDFQNQDNVIQLGLPPVRIDLITLISGVSWNEADASKEPGLFGDVSVSYIGKDQFIINKRASGRKKDLADLESLGEE